MSLNIPGNAFASYSGLREIFYFTENNESISVVVQKVSSACCKVINNIQGISQEQILWNLRNGYWVHLDYQSDILSFIPGLSGGGKRSGVNTPKTTQDLACALRKTNPKNEEHAQLLKIAYNVIGAYKSHSTHTPAQLRELVVLAQSGQEQLNREILKIVYYELHSAPLLDVDLLIALSDTLQATNPQHFDPDDLVNILKTLRSKFENFHVQKTTFSKLYEFLKVLSGILDVMGDANVEKLSYDNLHDPLYRALQEFTKHEDWRIATQATYAKESLVRIGHDKTKLMLFLNRTVNVVSGISSVGQVILNKDPSALLTAYESFKDALHSQGKPQSWYHEIRLLKILIDNQQLKIFSSRTFILNPKTQLHLCNGVFLLLIETVTNHPKPSIRLAALKLLNDLNTTLKINIQEALYAQLKEWTKDSDRNVASLAKQTFDSFDGTSKGNVFAINRRLPLEPSSSLFDPSTSTPKTIPEHIRKLRKNYLDDQSLKILLDTYITPQCTHTPLSKSSSPLEQEVERFLSSDKKVLLLQGGSGAGKTTFGKYLTYHLWKTWKKTDPICLFIPPVISTTSKRAVEETLENHGFSQNQIQRLKKEQRFLFIFDAYDEIGKRVNLYHQNRLGEWNAQVIVTCRTQYLPEDYETLFAPLGTNGAETRLLIELWITPFTDKEIDAYLQQYLAHSSSPVWKDYKEYLKHINQIVGLKDLISVPFLLHVTAEVLPNIVIRHQRDRLGEKLKLLKIDLYDAYISQWFQRSEARLQKTNSLTHFEGDIKTLFFQYCKRLASKMFTEGVTIVSYTPPIWGEEEENPWDEFFGTKDPLVLMLRDGAPLQKVDGNSYSFIHKSVLEYFIFRENVDQMTEQKPSKGKEIANNQESTSTNKGKGTVTDTPDNFAKKRIVGNNEMLHFYADAISKDDSLRHYFFAIIEESKQDPSKAIAAANSITILNAAGVSFSGLDLRGIQIPGADLEGAVLDGASLDGADLRKVVLKNACLRKCSLRMAYMEGVVFGERSFYQYPDDVTGVAVSPDGKLIAAGCSDHAIRIRVLETNKPYLNTLRGHRDRVNRCTFSPDGKILASGCGGNPSILNGSKDEDIILWSLETGKILNKLGGHEKGVSSFTFSSDGKYFFSRSVSGLLCIWDVNKGKLLFSNNGEDFGPSCFSHSGKFLFSKSVDDEGKLFNFIREVKTGKVKVTMQMQHDNPDLNCYAFSHNEELVAAGGSDNLLLWEADTGRLLIDFKECGWITSCVFSPDDKLIATGTLNGLVSLWEVERGKLLTIFETNYSSGSITGVEACAFSPDGKLLLSGISENIHFWEINIKKPSMKLENTLSSLFRQVESGAFSPDGKYMACGNTDQIVRIYEMQTGKLLSKLEGHSESVIGCKFSPDGKFLTSVSDETICWNIETGEQVYSLGGYEKKVKACDFSQDGKKVILGHEKEVDLYDLDSQKGLASCELPDSITTCALSPDGRVLAFGDKSGNFQVGSIDKSVDFYIPMQILVPGGSYPEDKGIIDSVRCCTFSLDGNFFAWGTKLCLCIYRLKGNKKIMWIREHAKKGHANAFSACAFHPNGKLLVSGRSDGTIQFWDIKTKKILSVIETHSGSDSISSLIFSPDGMFLSSGSYDKSVRIWQIFNTNRKLEPRLHWTSMSYLNALGANLYDAQLSTSNQELLMQRGAIISSQREKEKQQCSLM